jgi:hypothetical protein
MIRKSAVQMSAPIVRGNERAESLLGRKVVNALRKQGIVVIGSGMTDTYGMTPRSFTLVKDETSFIRLGAEVEAIAAGRMTLAIQ